MNNKPFLIILNKKDRERCIDEIQFTDRFNLHNLANQYRTPLRVVGQFYLQLLLT